MVVEVTVVEVNEVVVWWEWWGEAEATMARREVRRVVVDFMLKYEVVEI